MKFLPGFTEFIPRFLGFVLVMVMAASINTSFVTPAISEQALTVAYLYNFLKFAEWPEGAVIGELTRCAADSATFGQELDAISGRKAQNKSLRIKRIELGERPRECQLLFLPREEKPVRIREWLKNTDNMPILMVSNMDEFLAMGGMIVLISDDNRLQFEVNLKPVKRVDLNLSGQFC